MSTNPPTVLITGASGHLGRRTAEIVLEQSRGRIVLATRSPAKLADLAARGAEVRSADFDDPASLVRAFGGIDRLLLISTDALAKPGHRLAQHRAALAAAQQAGVRHVVYTSVAKAGPDSVATATPDHYATEQLLAASTLGWTILRNNLYTDYLLPKLAHAVATGQLATASGEGAIAYVTREDCAQTAAAALLAGNDSRQTLEISGPAAFTAGQLAALAARVTDRPVQYVPVPADALRSGLVASGLPPFLADLLVTFDLAAAHGELGLVTDSVAQLTRRSPVTVAEFLTAHLTALLPANS